jgi:hypothetical protein
VTIPALNTNQAQLGTQTGSRCPHRRHYAAIRSVRGDRRVVARPAQSIATDSVMTAGETADFGSEVVYLGTQRGEVAAQPV